VELKNRELIMAYVLDVKHTIWQRIEFDTKEQMLDVQERLKSGELTTGLDVIDHLAGDCEIEYLYDTLEEMYPEENQGNPTIEIMNDEQGEVIWKNI
jgi:hypothetical protein